MLRTTLHGWITGLVAVLCDSSSIFRLKHESASNWKQIVVKQAQNWPDCQPTAACAKVEDCLYSTNWSVCQSAPPSLNFEVFVVLSDLFCFHYPSEGTRWRIPNVFFFFLNSSDENDPFLSLHLRCFWVTEESCFMFCLELYSPTSLQSSVDSRWFICIFDVFQEK